MTNTYLTPGYQPVVGKQRDLGVICTDEVIAHHATDIVWLTPTFTDLEWARTLGFYIKSSLAGNYNGIVLRRTIVVSATLTIVQETQIQLPTTIAGSYVWCVTTANSLGPISGTVQIGLKNTHSTTDATVSLNAVAFV